MWLRFTRFLEQPLLNKLHSITTLYYKFKGALFYRFVFAKFGAGSYIRRPILIWSARFISVGKAVSIRDGVRLEVIQSNPSMIPMLAIGDETNIEQGVHIVCHNRVLIGKRVSITGYCSIVDVTHPFDDIYDPVKIGARVKDDDASVEIGDGAFLGFGAVVLPNVKIGRSAVIGANSVVSCDIPDYSVAVGSPARVIKQYDRTLCAWVKVTSADKDLL